MINRNLTEEDKTLLADWIAKEPDHKHTPEFYFEPGSKTIMYQDEQGPVFAVKYSSALRVDVEFNPEAEKDRIREALKIVVPDVAAQAKDQKFKEIVFTSVSKPLIAFCRLLGFSAIPDYRKVI